MTLQISYALVSESQFPLKKYDTAPDTFPSDALDGEIRNFLWQVLVIHLKRFKRDMRGRTSKVILSLC